MTLPITSLVILKKVKPKNGITEQLHSQKDKETKLANKMNDIIKERVCSVKENKDILHWEPVFIVIYELQFIGY